MLCVYEVIYVTGNSKNICCLLQGFLHSFAASIIQGTVIKTTENWRSSYPTAQWGILILSLHEIQSISTGEVSQNCTLCKYPCSLFPSAYATKILYACRYRY